MDNICGQIIQARKYISKCEAGDEVCASCGRLCTGTPVKKAVKTNFTDQCGLLVYGGEVLCSGCMDRLYDADMRFKPVIFIDGSKRVLARNEVLEIIQYPPVEFVMSVPYGFKKHHWLYAGLSNQRIAYIGVDSRCVVIDYDKNPAKAIEYISLLLQTGITRDEIISGHYSLINTAKYSKLIMECELVLSEFRPTGATNLFVKYTPAIQTKQKREAEAVMLTSTERAAIFLLRDIAVASNFRKENGLRFWDGFFLRRINRFKDLPLHEFISALSESIGCSQAALAFTMEDLDSIPADVVMDEIRTKSHLLTSLAYDEMRKMRK